MHTGLPKIQTEIWRFFLTRFEEILIFFKIQKHLLELVPNFSKIRKVDIFYNLFQKLFFFFNFGQICLFPNKNRSIPVEFELMKI